MSVFCRIGGKGSTDECGNYRGISLLSVVGKVLCTVNRDALWEILKRLGCPDKFVTILKLFHDDMKAVINVGGKLADPISVENGVKQGDIPAPTLFALYFTMVFRMAFGRCSDGVYIRYRTTGGLFNIRRFNASTKVLTKMIHDLLYADDCDLVVHTVTDIQHLVDAFAVACSALGLTINLKKKLS